MPEDTFSPQAIVQRLTTEAVTLNFMHQYAEYDDYYTIRYSPKKKLFIVHIEVSVWDGRGHETYDEKLDETTLLERLEKIKSDGTIRTFYYASKK